MTVTIRVKYHTDIRYIYNNIIYTVGWSVENSIRSVAAVAFVQMSNESYIFVIFISRVRKGHDYSTTKFEHLVDLVWIEYDTTSTCVYMHGHRCVVRVRCACDRVTLKAHESGSLTSIHTLASNGVSFNSLMDCFVGARIWNDLVFFVCMNRAILKSDGRTTKNHSDHHRDTVYWLRKPPWATAISHTQTHIQNNTAM